MHFLDLGSPSSLESLSWQCQKHPVRTLEGRPKVQDCLFAWAMPLVGHHKPYYHRTASGPLESLHPGEDQIGVQGHGTDRSTLQPLDHLCRACSGWDSNEEEGGHRMDRAPTRPLTVKKFRDQVN
jgi:hypothetical protein